MLILEQTPWAVAVCDNIWKRDKFILANLEAPGSE